MAMLNAQTRLQRIPEINLHIRSDNMIDIFLPGEHLIANPHSLSVLEVFRAPLTLADGLHILQPRAKNIQEWIYLTGAIHHLFQAGVLRDPDHIEAQLGSDSSHFDASPIHVLLLNDKVRTDRYLAAIREVVRPGDVVVDIGTGTGILAIGAALAGARHVYAIEASGIGKAAQRVFDANGLSDRITLVEGWSTQVTLPELADVLVSELISNDTFGEEVLQVTADATRRLLKPGARLVPSAVRSYGIPISVPTDWLTAGMFGPENVEQWRQWYGIDFSPLIAVGNHAPVRVVAPMPAAADWKALGAPVLLAGQDLSTIRDTGLDARSEAMMSEAGTLNGVLTYFEADLSPSVVLSTRPTHGDRPFSWHNPLWVFPSREVAPGDVLRLRLQSAFRGFVTLSVE